MWDPWRKPSVLLVHFFVTIFTMTSSIVVTMTPAFQDPGLEKSLAMGIAGGGGGGGRHDDVGGTPYHLQVTGNMPKVEQEAISRTLLGISLSSSGASSSSSKQGHQRIASSSRLGKASDYSSTNNCTVYYFYISHRQRILTTTTKEE